MDLWICFTFFIAAGITAKVDFFSTESISEAVTLVLGNLMEDFQDNQKVWGDESAWDPEDAWSNITGAMFGRNLGIIESFVITSSFIEKFSAYITQGGFVDKNDHSINRNNVKIREDQNDAPLPQRPRIYSPYYGEPVNAKAAP